MALVVFLESTPQSMLATDGHAKKGEFLPPITLPRRMWAGSRFSFKKSLKAGDNVIRISRIKDISVKQVKLVHWYSLMLLTK